MPEPSENVEVGRPDMPAGYGLAPVGADKDLMTWESVEKKLQDERNYWVCTTRPDSRPHAMPVWGLWLDGAFLFSTDPLSRKGRNITANPEVVMHLESGDDVVIVEGKVAIETDAALIGRADQAYYLKYRFHLSGDQAPEGTIYRLKPRLVMAWLESSFPNSATRWKFDE